MAIWRQILMQGGCTPKNPYYTIPLGLGYARLALLQSGSARRCTSRGRSSLFVLQQPHVQKSASTLLFEERSQCERCLCKLEQKYAELAVSER